MESFGIIAGNGLYPILMARAAKAQGVRRVVVAAFEGETDPSISAVADEVVWIRVGQLGKMIKIFTSRNVTEVAMVGQISLQNLWDVRPDFRALAALIKMKERNAETIFGGTVNELQKDGVTVVPATRFLEDHLAKLGLIAGPSLSGSEKEDVIFGARIAKSVSAMEIGQTVVVKKGTVLAVEAFESTNDAMLRGGKIGKGKVVLVKVSKPNHDFRYDVPVMGMKTMDIALESGVRVLAMESGKTLLLEKDEMFGFARKHGISLYAFEVNAQGDAIVS
ncbi:MAG: UDP-2,3-diacylglucosamine diphosphatase LpxI [Verrucomicrobiota bacterium]|nr:UDP-2,3-diacylglucosamine diphosphatase LpxI [Verrucomicrobiota bacterium]